MDIGVVRDFVISITGILVLILYILVIVFGFLLYREIKALTNSIKGTINTAKEMGSDVKQTIKNSKDLINIIKGPGKKTEDKSAAGKTG